MLNQPLYDSLVRVFGKVKVENKGVPARILPKPGTVSEWDLPDDEQHGEQYRVCCPYCNDRNFHLYVSYLSFAVPKLDDRLMMKAGLLALCFRRQCLHDADNRMDFMRRIGSGLNGDVDGQEVKVGNALLLDDDDSDNLYSWPEHPDISGFRGWVPDYKPINIDAPEDVLDYLRERRITTTDVEMFHLGWGPIKSPTSGEYLTGGAPWILIPIIQHGKLKGMQARALPEFCDGKFKYWLHPGSRKRTLVGNLDNAQKLGLGVVTEGWFDVFSVGMPGVCIFGHTPSTYQKMLLGSFDHGLIWLPDTDVRPDLDPIAIAERRCEEWNVSGHFPKGAHVVKLPAKDAGSMTRQAVWREICSQVPDTMRDFLLSRIVPRL
jgi:hypothetical protein